MNIWHTQRLGFTFIFTYTMSHVIAFKKPLWSKAMDSVRYEESTKQPTWAATPLAGMFIYEGNSHKCTCCEHCNLTIYSHVFCGTSKLFICVKFKQTKMLSVLRRKKKNGNEETPLMKNIEQTDGKTVSCYFSIIGIDLTHLWKLASLHLEKQTSFHLYNASILF